MKSRLLIAPVALLSAVSLSACAENYAAEGAAGGGALGAAVAAVTGGDIVKYALAGAAAGGLAGYFVDKNDGCDGYDRNGYLDDDCFGTRGYPADPRR
ncbi:glycine zipper domain-containing protein [Erythrobacter sp. LQ02-29]|uniref:glycine zipper domain-containing protein n=1 Tax=unclassified Erythrobacter TaxID=2633097 RepID=UPI001F4D85C4|nr:MULTISPECIES: glycine zipper domain-containing protein [unclassified Erythrobacter]MCP9223223.1 glycine zipper domain-containing protein [Erythrobacter sp. LQ02-29]